jgi:hypothetical protein
MTQSCPVPTPAERRYGEILTVIQQKMVRRVYEAIREATEEVGAEIGAAQLDMPPPSPEYFASVIHQSIYCTLCKADPETFAGGKADIAITIIRNCQNIARHYWGADIKV